MKKFIPPTKNKITALAFAILPVLITGLLAYGANIYYDLDAGKIVNGENNELTQNLTVAGSVGIGTTSPAGALHVMGQCVTGDTKLRRRRKKSKSQGSNSKDEYEYEDVEIKDIQAGDEILTLDENTGRLVVSRVNALMDMGVKEIYKLTTATGKTIRTTANHPYLAVDGFDNERAAVFVDSANFEMSCRFCGLEKDYVKMDKFFFGAMKKSAKTFRFYKVDFGGNKQRKFFDFLDIIGAKIVSKPIKVIKQKQKANEHKANFDVELAVDAVELKEKYDTAIIVSGDSDFAYMAEHLQKAGKKTIVISPWRRTGKELRQQADMYFDLRNMPFVGRVKIKRPPVGGINPGFSPALPILSQVHPFVKGAGRWTKVSQLREGQMIAVAGDNNRPQYERIAKIEKLPAEQVYDIEVAGTHNFVGNGIVAHNTYLQGADQLNTSFALRVQDSAGADNFVVTNAGNVGIGTTDLSGAKFKIAGDDSAVADNYNDLSQIAGNTNAAAVSGKLQIAEAACGDYTIQGAGGLTYGTVLGPDGKCWLDRNLGATQVATSAADVNAYGYYYQWGRPTDGHQIENSGTTAVNADSDIPGHANFITEDTSPYDWRVPQSPNEATLWAGAGGGSNNPCPAGWHVPTSAEWVTVAGYFSPQTSVGAFNSTLKLPLAGYRDRASASLYGRGGGGLYWSGGPSGTYAASLGFNSSAVNPASTSDRAYGFSVRCVKD
jgi:uncharacterized protein (TIGR02145 family)